MPWRSMACHSTAEHINKPSVHYNKLNRIHLLDAEMLPTACPLIKQTVVGYCQSLITSLSESMLHISATSTVWIKNLPSQGAVPLSRISHTNKQPTVRFLQLGTCRRTSAICLKISTSPLTLEKDALYFQEHKHWRTGNLFTEELRAL